ncbi:MAG: polyhydroxyalkanoic acid system family protein [Myxococcota bacterium]
MARMRFERAYALADDDVRARLRALGDYWRAKHGITLRWVSDELVELEGSKLGVTFRGEVQVREGRITADMEANWMAKKLGAQAYVERKLDAYLDPAASLAELEARAPRA